MSALVLQEYISPMISKAISWRNPTSGSDNTPTLVWAFKEAVNTIHVVSDILRIRSYHNRCHRLSLSVFYHHIPLKTMSDDTYRRFDLYPRLFLAFFHFTYNPQSPGSWNMCHLTTEVLSSVISDLRKRPYEADTYPTAAPSPCTSSDTPSTPISRCTTFSRTRISQLSRYFRCTDTRSITLDSTPNPLSYDRNWLQWHSRISPRPTFWRDVETRASLLGRTQEISISASPACSGTYLTKTPLPRKIRISPLESSW